MQRHHQEEGLLLQQQLHHTIETLLSRSYASDTQERLDNLLKAQPPARLAKAMRSWATGEENKNTWLTNAVHSRNFEIVAILLYHGADAHQPCPRRDGLTAFDGAFTHYHAQRRPWFYLMATLLNNKDVPPDRARLFKDDHLMGADPDTLLLDVSAQGEESEGSNTPLTMAIREGLPYTVRYLVERRNCDIRVRDARDNMLPIEIAMALGTRNDKQARLKQRMVQYLQRGERALAFMMAHQRRLGGDSSLRHLFPETLERISHLASQY